MDEQQAIIDEITEELLGYCGPIFIAPAINSYPGQMIGNGTYALVDTGQKRLLVTCCHVWDEYLQQHDANGETILAVTLGEGDSIVAFKDPERQLIAADRDLDLAVFEFEPEGIRVRHRKDWFKISHWPIPKVEKGECIVTMGFPGASRRTAGTECRFGCVAIPVVITDVTDRSIAIFYVDENQEVLNDMQNSLGGVSGSPAYRLSDDGDLKIVGFTKGGSLESNAPNRKYQAASGSPLSSAAFFTHASFLRQDGTFGL